MVVVCGVGIDRIRLKKFFLFSMNFFFNSNNSFALGSTKGRRVRMVLGREAEVGACGRMNLVGTKRVVVGFGRTRVFFREEIGTVEGVLE